MSPIAKSGALGSLPSMMMMAAAGGHGSGCPSPDEARGIAPAADEGCAASPAVDSYLAPEAGTPASAENAPGDADEPPAQDSAPRASGRGATREARDASASRGVHDVAEPRTKLEREIEARNLALLKAGGAWEECGRVVYDVRLTIEKQMPFDPFVAPSQRTDRIREAKQGLAGLLARHANLARAKPARLLSELQRFHRKLQPIQSHSTESLREIAQLIRERLVSTIELVKKDGRRRAQEIEAEIGRLEQEGGRAFSLLGLKARLRELEDLEARMGTILDAFPTAAPRSFISEATKAIRRTERTMHVSRSASDEENAPADGDAAADGSAPAPRRGGRPRKRPLP